MDGDSNDSDDSEIHEFRKKAKKAKIVESDSEDNDFDVQNDSVYMNLGKMVNCLSISMNVY